MSEWVCECGNKKGPDYEKCYECSHPNECEECGVKIKAVDRTIPILEKLFLDYLDILSGRGSMTKIYYLKIMFIEDETKAVDIPVFISDCKLDDDIASFRKITVTFNLAHKLMLEG